MTKTVLLESHYLQSYDSIPDFLRLKFEEDRHDFADMRPCGCGASEWRSACEWHVGTVNAEVMSRRAKQGLIENIHSMFGTLIFEIIYLACPSSRLPKFLLRCAL